MVNVKTESQYLESKIVVGKGNPAASLMLIGEAPGSREELEGLPFVGRSGKFMDKLMIQVGINPLCDIYFCNAVKCRPPNNRRPSKKEISNAAPWLYQQIELVDPLVIILAGSTAIEALLGFKGTISNLRGTWQSWNGRMIMPLFHPAYLLRNPSRAKGKPFDLTKNDLIKVRKRLEDLNVPSFVRKLRSGSSRKL